MRKKVIRYLVITSIVFAMFIIAFVVIFPHVPSQGTYTDYTCDVAVFSTKTSINVTTDADGNDYAKIQGKSFSLFVDPLKMNKNGEEVAVAGDSYSFISQDAHGIRVYNGDTIDMVGCISFFGDSYELYDEEGRQLGTATFNSLNTEGKIKDMDGNLMAFYSSMLYRNDYNVRIYDNCTISEDAVLLIMASYYSDQHYDN
jgi:hypothetical protein